jgi:hypothetical protein
MNDELEDARPASQVPLPGGDFRMFTTRLSYQLLISLGLVENPVTRSSQPNLEHARMLLDDLRMLQDKTMGNLEPDEQAYLDKLISDLGAHYARIKGA